MRAVFVAFLIASAATLSFAQLRWGPQGHAIAAGIAQTLLDSSAVTQAQNLLPDVNGQIEQIASWADQVRNDPAYSWSAPLHFINTPDWVCDYVRSRDCFDDYGNPMMCVDGAIQNYTSRLADASLPSDQQTEALKFLVHFVGDVHQPLHCGFTSDRGGNDIIGTFYGESDKLHYIWDTAIIKKRMDNDFNGDQDAYMNFLIQQIQTTWAVDAQKWLQCANETNYDACSDEWGNESVQLACSNAYVDADGVTHLANGFDLSDAYYNRNYPIVDMQLAKAGVRMANTINNIFPSNNAMSVLEQLQVFEVIFNDFKH